MDNGEICGTARASAGRIGRLREFADSLGISVQRDGDELEVVLTATPDAPAHPAVNVHHSAAADGGYPFLDTVPGVLVEPGASVRVRFSAGGRTARVHLVLQLADAFAHRSLEVSQ